MQSKNYTHEERTYKKCTFVPKATNYLVSKLKEERMTPLERFIHAKQQHVMNRLLFGRKF